MQKYPSLNGLRAISILLVICGHLGIQHHVFNQLIENPIAAPFINILQDAHLGVNVFFVISGFLITSLLLQEEIQTQTISIKNFFIRRVLRIFPAYYFLLLVYFVLQLFKIIDISAASWLTAITYTKYFNWNIDWLTAHAWSLSVEEHFYILWPLVFIAGKRFRKIIAISLIIIVPLIRIYLRPSPNAGFYDLTLFERIDAIAIGCLFALYKDAIIKKLQPYFALVFYSSLIGLFLLPYLPQVAFNYTLRVMVTAIGSTHGSIANLLIALIMMYSVFGPQKTWFKFLNNKVINYIGLLSYSIYLWQQLFISGLPYWPFSFPINLLFIIAMALFSYYIIEKPFLKLKAKFSKIKTNHS